MARPTVLEDNKRVSLMLDARTRRLIEIMRGDRNVSQYVRDAVKRDFDARS